MIVRPLSRVVIVTPGGANGISGRDEVAVLLMGIKVLAERAAAKIGVR
jgi:hypothetical protein